MDLAAATTYVQARLGVSSGESGVVDSLIGQQLDTEYQRLVLENRLVIDRAGLVLTAGDPFVDLPGDLAVILKMRRGSRTLEPIDFDDFTDLEGSPDTSGDVSAYAMAGTSRIIVTPLPGEDENEGLWLWYATSAPSWTGTDGPGTSASPDALPAAYHDLPCERVVAFLALLDEAMDLALAAQARADALEARLKIHLARRAGGGAPTIAIRGTRP